MDNFLSLNLDALCRFANCNVSSRSMVEGQQVISSGHIILCGSVLSTPDKIEIYSLCLQTSALTENPHTINGVINIVNSQASVETMSCSCKAGASESCKHIVAVLLYLNRHNILNLENVSTTDKKCVWTSMKGKTLDEYAPRPLANFCCIESQELQLPEEEQKSILKSFESVDRQSAYSKHIYRIRSDACELHSVQSTSSGVMSVQPYVPDLIATIIKHAYKSALMAELKDYYIELQPCCTRVYNVHFGGLGTEKIVQICKITMENINEWHKHRQFRITASRCYEIFTYSKEDWRTKAIRYFWPKSFTNKYVQHGIKHEDAARQTYVSDTNNYVVKCGIIISEWNEWLACSPDGIVLQNLQKPIKLIEIKCPFELKDVTEETLLEKCNFLTKRNNVLQLKEKHKYYGQVQLSLSVLNIESCDFVIYNSISKNIRIITIPINEIFCNTLLCKLKENYFGKMIHVLCE